eukprot:scaffold28_cov515-Prasinococcus_capsulatus_cf.AAC.22
MQLGPPSAHSASVSDAAGSSQVQCAYGAQLAQRERQSAQCSSNAASSCRLTRHNWHSSHSSRHVAPAGESQSNSTSCVASPVAMAITEKPSASAGARPHAHWHSP